MRTLLITLLSVCSFFHADAQEEDAASILLKQGIALHDKGDYEGAITLYDEIIRKDPRHYGAMYEKTFSLYASGRYQECIDLCKEIVKQFPREKDAGKVYVNYGSALDALKKPDEAIKIYSEGIRKFPEFYLLHFNRGITQYFQNDLEKSTEDFKQSVVLNPSHASSHQSLGYCVYKENKVAGIMALSVFLLLEPEGKRAEQNLKVLLQLLGANVQKKDPKNVTILLSPEMLNTKSKKEDDFHLTELALTIKAAVSTDKGMEVTPVQKLRGDLASLGEIVTDGKKSKKGFFTRFYVPFFKQLKSDSLLEVASYIMYSSGDDTAVKKWLQDNEAKVSAFYGWLEKYAWLKEEK